MKLYIRPLSQVELSLLLSAHISVIATNKGLVVQYDTFVQEKLIEAVLVSVSHKLDSCLEPSQDIEPTLVLEAA